MADDQKDGVKVLVLGGCGFIGRNFVKYLVDNKLASAIRVADKTQPMVSAMNEAHTAAFKNPIVEYKQADLTKDPHVERAFAGVQFDYVINCCGETRFGLSEEEYKSKCSLTAEKCGVAAKAQGVKKWIELSTAQVYAADKKPSAEEAKQDPWTTVARFRLEAEEVVGKIQGLPVVTLRPAVVYGSGDLTGLSPRITCAAVYQERQEKMKFLWDKGLKINSVHVNDVCAAIWLACTKAAAGSVYNLADKSDLDQGALNVLLANIFKIQTGFLGAALSLAAKAMLSAVAQEANDKHVPGWTKLCQKHNINNSPLSPYIDKELLKNNHLSVDGSKITKDLGFVYTVPEVTEAVIRAQIAEFIDNKQFPPVL